MDEFEKATDKYLSSTKKDISPLIKKVSKIVDMMIKAKKAKDNKALIKHHEALDKAIHDFVGEEGLTPEEK
jgi:hypothetical protein